MKRLLVLATLLFVLPAHAEVTIDWVTVGDPGNAADVTGYGAVGYVYKIGKYEVTNAQYADFLTAVAATDTYDLYSWNMANTGSGYQGGITRSGSSGSYTYSTIVSREYWPVNHVSLYDSLRFANWLHNGQPTGAQDSTTTEDGAYTFSGIYSVGARNSGATIFLPSEDEWYKAAYYKGGGTSTGYWDYPAGADAQTFCFPPAPLENTANCDAAIQPPDGYLTDVGNYTGSASPYGTFDQGGNVWERSEAIIGSQCAVRGGGFHDEPSDLAASYRITPLAAAEYHAVGFRVASAAEPEAVPSVSPTGVALMGGLIFGIGVMGMVIAARRRLN